MTDVITKVAIGGVEYPFAGGGSEGQEVVYLTQAEYDALPESKLTDGKIYKIKTSGVAPTPGGGNLTFIVSDCTADGTVTDLSGYDWFYITAKYNNNYVLNEIIHKDFILGTRTFIYNRGGTTTYPAGSIEGSSIDSMTVQGSFGGYVTLYVYGIN